MRRAFTLIELLITMVVIAILAAVMLGALSRADVSAKTMATRAQIHKLHNQVTYRWESYRTRRLPIDAQGRAAADMTAAGFSPNSSSYVSYIRLLALRELMRLEMPQRYEDVTGDVAFLLPVAPTDPLPPPVPLATLTNVPALSQAYLRRYTSAASRRTPPPPNGNGMPLTAPPTDEYQGAECLYMVVTMGIEDNSLGTDKLSLKDVGDVDDDGMPEFLDRFGSPINFLRWAPGFDSDLQPAADAVNRHDPFDATRLDRWPVEGFVDSNGDGSYTTGELFFDFNGNGSRDTALPLRGFRLFPLVFSAGPDRAMDIWAPKATGLSAAELNDPYHVSGMPTGTPMTPTSPQPGEGRHTDNIHNHLLTTQ